MLHRILKVAKRRDSGCCWVQPRAKRLRIRVENRFFMLFIVRSPKLIIIEEIFRKKSTKYEINALDNHLDRRASAKKD